jgi:hypothetical protein
VSEPLALQPMYTLSVGQKSMVVLAKVGAYQGCRLGCCKAAQVQRALWCLKVLALPDEQLPVSS